MFRELLKPLFLVLFLSMFLTAASELAPGQWVDFALSRTVHMPGILLLVYVSGLMFVMRHFAGPLVHRLSSIGLLWVSCLLAALGLVALSYANSPVMGMLAATLWGTGVCYMWPTMLATASERFPRGGALLMGLMGTAGTLSTQLVLPLHGRGLRQRTKIEVAGGEAAFNALQPAQSSIGVLGIAAQTSFRYVAVLPAILLIVFGGDLALRPLAGRLQADARSRSALARAEARDPRVAAGPQVERRQTMSASRLIATQMYLTGTIAERVSAVSGLRRPARTISNISVPSAGRTTQKCRGRLRHARSIPARIRRRARQRSCWARRFGIFPFVDRRQA